MSLIWFLIAIGVVLAIGVAVTAWLFNRASTTVEEVTFAGAEHTHRVQSVRRTPQRSISDTNPSLVAVPATRLEARRPRPAPPSRPLAAEPGRIPDPRGLDGTAVTNTAARHAIAAVFPPGTWRESSADDDTTAIPVVAPELRALKAAPLFEPKPAGSDLGWLDGAARSYSPLLLPDFRDGLIPAGEFRTETAKTSDGAQ